MNWHLIETGENTGNFNMEFDLELVKHCTDNDAFFRLYRWKPYCISLGANQSLGDIAIKASSEANIDIVKRPTGGRAILHAEEITYSVVLPYSLELSAKDIYKKISLALIRGMEHYNPLLCESELENIQPNFHEILKTDSGILCFGSAAKNEVKFKGKKIIGSAQRKLNHAVLQHGSILCGPAHKKLVNFLKVPSDVKRKLADEISEKTTEIESILNAQVDYNKLSECLIKGFEETWQTTLERNFSLCEHI